MFSTSYCPLDSLLHINLFKNFSICSLHFMLPAMLQQTFMGGALTKDTGSPSVAKFGGVLFLQSLSYITWLGTNCHLYPALNTLLLTSVTSHSHLLCDSQRISLSLSSGILQRFVLGPFSLVLNILSLDNFIGECNYHSYVNDPSTVIPAQIIFQSTL